jgi:hypothetical protein
MIPPDYLPWARVNGRDIQSLYRLSPSWADTYPFRRVVGVAKVLTVCLCSHHYSVSRTQRVMRSVQPAATACLPFAPLPCETHTCLRREACQSLIPLRYRLDTKPSGYAPILSLYVRYADAHLLPNTLPSGNFGAKRSAGERSDIHHRYI